MGWWGYAKRKELPKVSKKFPKGTFIGPREGGSLGGSGELFGLPIWRKKSKDKTPGVFFHAAFDFDTPGP